MAQNHYLIINGFGRSNRGDSVLLDQCIDQIRLVEPDAKLSAAVFSGIDAAMARHPDVIWSERLGNAARRGLLGRARAVANIGAVCLSLIPGLRWLGNVLPAEQRATLDAYRHANVVISAPGGYINDTNHSYLIALFHIWLGKRFGASVLLAPQSIGPLNSRLARSVARGILGECNALCVREGYSRRFLIEDLGLPDDLVKVTGDSAFWDFDVVDDADQTDAALAQIGLAPGEAFVGMTVVDWNFPNLDNPAALRQRYIDGMGAVTRHIHARHGLRTVIFNQVSSDLDAVREVVGLSQGAALVNEINYEPDVLRAMIARSTSFVGTRFHSCIFAMMASRPITAISYLPKTEFIMRDLGLEDRVVDIAYFDSERVKSLIDGQLADPQAATAQVAAAVERYRTEQRQFEDVLRHSIGG